MSEVATQQLWQERRRASSEEAFSLHPSILLLSDSLHQERTGSFDSNKKPFLKEGPRESG
jgi:hypothetical protein